MARIINQEKLSKVIRGLMIAQQADDEELDVLNEWQVNASVHERLFSCARVLEEVIEEAKASMY